MKQITVALIALFLITLGLTQLLKQQGEIDLIDISHRAHTPSHTESIIRHYTYSKLIAERRARARAGIELYLDWYYSLKGSLVGQGAMVYQALDTFKRGLKDPLDQRVESELSFNHSEVSSEVISHDAPHLTTSPNSSASTSNAVVSYFEELDSQNKLRLYQLVFRHLTDWSVDELQALSDEIRGRSRLLIGVFDRSLVRDAARKLNKTRYMYTPFKHQRAHEVKFGVSAMMALVEVSLVRTAWVHLSERATQRAIAHQLALSVARYGGKTAGIEAAGIGALWCSVLGPISTSVCAITGFAVGFIASEWAITVFDEGYNRAELRAEMYHEVKRAFDQFEHALNASLVGGQREAQDAESDRSRVLRLIDLFD